MQWCTLTTPSFAVSWDKAILLQHLATLSFASKICRRICPTCSNVTQRRVKSFTSRIFSPAEPIASIKVGDYALKLRREVKNLGRNLNRHLAVKTHINNIYRSAPHLLTESEKSGKFNQTLLRSALYMLSFLLNIISATVFFVAYPTELEKLQSFQN